MPPWLHLLRLLCAALSALAAFPTVQAADAVPANPEYPARAVTLVVPFAAGGEADGFARNLADSAARYLGARIVVENRPGESGALASARVHDAAPDGYTLLLGRAGPLVIAPAFARGRQLRAHDFTILSMVEIDPLVCAVRADLPYRSGRELLDALRARPGSLVHATGGAHSASHAVVSYMLALGGLPPDASAAQHFDNGGAAVAAVLDGRAHFLCISGSALGEAIRSGRLRGLFTTAPGRMAQWPQLENAREAGLRDLGNLSPWSALLGPPGLPEAVQARWRAALGQLARDQVWLGGIVRLGGLPSIRQAGDSAAFIESQRLLYERLRALEVKP